MSNDKLTKRQQAFEMYKEHKGKIDLVEIANSLGSPPGTVRGWKSKDKWDEQLGGTLQQKKRSVPKKKPERSKEKHIELVIDNDELTEAQKMFCLYYLQHFNATKAYQLAYPEAVYATARAEGSRHLAKPNIKKELHRLKAELQKEAYVTVEDIIHEYAKQFGADITDIVKVGLSEYQLRDKAGKRMVDKNGKPIMAMYNDVYVEPSDNFDGGLVKKISQGKDGISVEMYDKQKAMSELMKYLGGDELRQAQINKLNKSMEVDNRTEDKLKDYFEALGAEIDGIE